MKSDQEFADERGHPLASTSSHLTLSTANCPVCCGTRRQREVVSEYEYVTSVGTVQTLPDLYFPASALVRQCVC
jgi:aldehyde:ferredoxin oxidoreductase